MKLLKRIVSSLWHL